MFLHLRKLPDGGILIYHSNRSRRLHTGEWEHAKAIRAIADYGIIYSALDDIRASIDELKYYKQSMFKPTK